MTVYPAINKTRETPGNDAVAKRRRLAPLQKDLAWLRTRINADTDPTVQRFITEIKNRIAAAERRGRP
jgi:hypothetical protein